MSDLATRVSATIRDVPDFPKPGILFKDITPVLQDGPLFKEVTQHFANRCADRGITRVVGIESRGFIFGAPIANALGVGFTVIRKPGKLPWTTHALDYELEYGTDRVEMHIDGVAPTDKIALVDDLLATGGTAGAARKLIEQAGAQVDVAMFLIELGFLAGRDNLGAVDTYALVTY